MRLGMFLSFVIGTAAWPLHAADFEKDIKPLFAAKCAECHFGSQPKGHLDLSKLESILKGGEKGPAVVPGSLRQSILWSQIATDAMPATKVKLTATEKESIRRWIMNLAPSKAVANKVGGDAGKGHSPAEVAKVINREIAEKLKEVKLPESAIASDEEFLRRAYIDIVGHIPTGQQARDFLDDRSAGKREALIEALLNNPDFGKHFASIWTNAVYAAGDPDRPVSTASFTRWLGEEINKGAGWDEIVRTMYTAEAKSPAEAFYAINNNDPGLLSPATTQLFLGTRIECAECHNHPYASWTLTDFWGLAACFDSLPAKNGKAPVALNGKIKVPATNGNRGAGKIVEAKFLEGTAAVESDGPLQRKLAAWLTAKTNRAFARNYVNRLWGQMLGAGFVNPVDDFHEDAVASHPALLEFLTDEFIASGFNIRHLVRSIASSEPYQRTSTPLPANKEDQSLFSHMLVKVMTPEVLYDSLVSALGVQNLPGGLGSSPRIGMNEGGNKKNFGSASPPSGKRGLTAKGSSTARQEFLAFFKTQDDYGTTTAYTQGIPQVLALLNNSQFNDVPPTVEQLVKKNGPPEQAVESLFLETLSRRPTADEKKIMIQYLAGRDDHARGLQGVLWVLLNMNEFVLVR